MALGMLVRLASWASDNQVALGPNGLEMVGEGSARGSSGRKARTKHHDVGTG